VSDSSFGIYSARVDEESGGIYRQGFPGHTIAAFRDDRVGLSIVCPEVMADADLDLLYKDLCGNKGYA
jgi:hypothetical protein